MRVIKPTCAQGDDLRSQLRDVLTVKSELQQIQKNEYVVLDLSGLKWVCPAFIVPLMVVIHELQDQIGQARFRVIYPYNDSVAAYLRRIGFPGGVDIKDITPGYTTFPLVNIPKTRDEMILDKLTDLIETHFPDHVQAIAFSLQELTTNIYEHSMSSKGFLMAQHYPNKKFMDICIADNGIGLTQSYLNHGIKVQNDIEAIQKAYSGVSTKDIESSKDTKRGFGISSSSRIITEGCDGKFLLLSKTAGLHIHNQGMNKDIFDIPLGTWDGTLAIGRFKLDKVPKSIYSYVEGHKKEGES